ncbi:54S ribosomal protein L36, mitochondrial [Smittium mucronatum]|uniref:54S ribosomal protein L36, mitochondrial n=1 Tax=Smittium mucronatum TaxID=133383 RepID=A0A1R0GVT0_9FUNG|nr:54S ribosomal protein L36, mitochondrial [Smittium mucronatum]
MEKTNSSLRYAKTMAKLWRPRKQESLAHSTFKMQQDQRLPETFNQRIVLSDGSSYMVRSTSPKLTVKLSKDTRNHHLWNPQSKYDLNDEGGHLSKFNKRFGDYGNLDDF